MWTPKNGSSQQIMLIAKLLYKDPLLETVWSNLETSHVKIWPAFVDESPATFVFGVFEVNTHQFENWIEKDQSIITSCQIAEISDGTLYQCDLNDLAIETSPLLQLTGDQVEIHRLRLTPDGWYVLLETGSRSVLAQLLDFCDERGIEIESQHLHRKIDQEGLAATLTDDQYAALSMALENGYFAVPREYSVKELADQLEISEAATCNRLRRGLETIVTQIFDQSHDENQ